MRMSLSVAGIITLGLLANAGAQTQPAKPAAQTPMEKGRSRSSCTTHRIGSYNYNEKTTRERSLSTLPTNSTAKDALWL